MVPVTAADGKVSYQVTVLPEKKDKNDVPKPVTFKVSDSAEFLKHIRKDITFAEQCARKGFDVKALDITTGISTLHKPGDKNPVGFTIVNTEHLKPDDIKTLSAMMYYSMDPKESKINTDFRVMVNGKAFDLKYKPGDMADLINNIVLKVVCDATAKAGSQADSAGIEANKKAAVLALGANSAAEMQGVADMDESMVNMLNSEAGDLSRCNTQKTALLESFHLAHSTFGDKENRQEGEIYDNLKKAEVLKKDLGDYITLKAALKDKPNDPKLLRAKNDLEAQLNGPQFTKRVKELREQLTTQKNPPQNIEYLISKDSQLETLRKVDVDKNTDAVIEQVDKDLGRADAAVKIAEYTAEANDLQAEIDVWKSIQASPESLSKNPTQQEFCKNHPELVTQHLEMATANLAQVNTLLAAVVKKATDTGIPLPPGPHPCN